MFSVIAKAIGATPDNPQSEEAGSIIAGLYAADEGTWHRLYNVFQESLHSSCCGGVGQPGCFRTKESAEIAAGETTFSGRLIAEVEASHMVCPEHHHRVCCHRRPA